MSFTFQHPDPYACNDPRFFVQYPPIPINISLISLLDDASNAVPHLGIQALLHIAGLSNLNFFLHISTTRCPARSTSIEVL